MNKTNLNPRDKWSFLTHFMGVILSTIGALTIIIGKRQETSGVFWVMLVFGISMIALYTCSSVYHYSNGDANHIKRLRKLDHSMIYVLIAGTYTPILYIGMEYPKNIIFLAGIWIFAIAGIIMKVCWLNAPRWLSTSIYILMGWAIVFDIKALTSMPATFIHYLIAGGVSYTVGAILYIIKRPNIFKKFGFHEIFHVFIMIGTMMHFIGIYFFLI